MSSLSNKQKFQFGSNYSNTPLLIMPATQVSKISIQLTSGSEIKKAFILTAKYCNGKDTPISVDYDKFFFQFDTKDLITSKNDATDNFICTSIVFEYIESSMKTENYNGDVVFYMEPFELSEGERKAYEQQLTNV